jgi:Xaa-Pro aminopeptidase
VTRTVAIGQPSAEMRQRYTAVLKGHIAISTARFPAGSRGIDLDPLARHALWQLGLDYDHGTGHGVGSYLSVHEGPAGISKRAMVALEPGMILSNEPGYYKTGAYGIRIENLVLVEPGRIPAGGERSMLSFETLTLVPYDRRLVELDMLSAAERAWINAYHARVAAEIGPLIEDGPTRAWLKAATAPL